MEQFKIPAPPLCPFNDEQISVVCILMWIVYLASVFFGIFSYYIFNEKFKVYIKRIDEYENKRVERPVVEQRDN